MTLKAYANAACTQLIGTLNDIGSAVSGAKVQTILNTGVPFYLKDDAGKRTPSAVTVIAVSGHGVSAYDTDFTVSANGTDYVTAFAGLSLGIIGSTAIPVYVKQDVGKANTEADRTAYIRATFGGDSIDLPVLSSAQVSGVTAVGCTISAVFNPVVTSAKWIVTTSNTPPDSSAWSAATAFSTVPSATVSVTGLPNSTLHYAFVIGYDADGFSVASAPQSFTTGTVSNLAPAFTAQPSVKAGTLTATSVTIEYGATDSDGDTIVHELSLDDGTTYSAATATYNGTSGKWEIAKTGLSDMAYTMKVRIGDTAHVGANGTSSNSIAVTGTLPVLTGTLVATPSLGQVALDWSNATDNIAVTGYDVEYGLTVSYGSSITDPTTSAATITGLTAGTLYYFRVRAHDAAGNVSAWITTTATVATGFVDTFDTLDTARWFTSVGGSGTVDVSAGKLVFGGENSIDDCNLAGLKTPIDVTANATYKALGQVRLATSNADAPLLISIQRQATQPVVGTAAAFNAAQIIGISAYHNTATAPANGFGVSFTYWNPANGAVQYQGTWGGGPIAWSATGIPDNTYYTFIIETSATAGSGGTPAIRCIVKSADETTTHVISAWVNLSSIHALSGNYYVVAGDPFDNAYIANMDIDAFTEEVQA